MSAGASTERPLVGRVVTAGDDWLVSDESWLPARPTRRHRLVRNTPLGVLLADVAALAVTGAVLLHRSTSPVTPDRGTVVESRCIDGRISQSIDDGNPAGLLAYDTGVSC